MSPTSINQTKREKFVTLHWTKTQSHACTWDRVAGLSRKPLEPGSYPPGQHGQKSRLPLIFSTDDYSRRFLLAFMVYNSPPHLFQLVYSVPRQLASPVIYNPGVQFEDTVKFPKYRPNIRIVLKETGCI